MAGLGRQAVVLTTARFLNYGLTFLSPIILVRLLSVEQFGQYRQFIVYASFLQMVAAFSFSESLLYFIPAHSKSPWRVVAQANLLTMCATAAVVITLVIADMATGGAVVSPYLWPLVAYVLLFVNLDFWEYFLLARQRPVAVFVYSAARLTARMLVVVGSALLTHDVNIMIWALVTLEGVRLVASAIVWRISESSSKEPPLVGAWRAQLQYCVPAGLATLLTVANRNVGNIAVARVLGVVALAHYTIGTYAEYVYVAIGNSIAIILLPEMVRRHAASKHGGLDLWRKATVVNCLLLLPAAVLLARYAEPLIITAFGEKYRSAIPVLQIHMLFMVRACFDFSPAVRAINKTRPLVYSNIAALLVNALMLMLLLPGHGIVGAVMSLVISSFAEALVLGWFTTRLYGVPVLELVPWRRVGKVFFAAIASAAVILSPFWTDTLGLAGLVLAAVTYYGVFAILLRVLRVAEAATLFERFRASMAAALAGRAT